MNEFEKLPGMMSTGDLRAMEQRLSEPKNATEGFALRGVRAELAARAGDGGKLVGDVDGVRAELNQAYAAVENAACAARRAVAATTAEGPRTEIAEELDDVIDQLATADCRLDDAFAALAGIAE